MAIFTDDIVTRLKADTRQYDKNLKKSTKQSGLFGRAWEGISKRLIFTAGDLYNAFRKVAGGMVDLVKQGGTYGDVMANVTVDVTARGQSHGRSFFSSDARAQGEHRPVVVDLRLPDGPSERHGIDTREQLGAGHRLRLENQHGEVITPRRRRRVTRRRAGADNRSK